MLPYGGHALERCERSASLWEFPKGLRRGSNMQHQLTISALARAEGVDQAAMSRLVKQLKLETSPGPRGAKLVAVASYLQAVGRPATEQLQPPSDQLERLARKGKLGTARECASRLAAARSYQHLVKAAASCE